MDLSEKAKESGFISIALIGILCLIPLFFVEDDASLKEGSSYLKIIESNTFIFMVVGTLGMSVPLTVDYMVNTLLATKTGNLQALYLYGSSKLLLCVGSLVPSALYIVFSYQRKQLIATTAILLMKNISQACVLGLQANARKPDIYTWRFTSAAFVCLVISEIIEGYSAAFYHDTTRLISLLFRALAFVIAISRVGQHIWLIIKGRIDLGPTHWQSIVISLLIALIFAWIAYGTAAGLFPESIYDNTRAGFIGHNIMIACAAVIVNAVLNTESTLAQNSLNEKLAMKRLFVRFVSHEVRTPLNSCILGLKYLAKQFESFVAGATISSGNGVTNSVLPSSPGEVLEVLNDITRDCGAAVDFMDNLLLYEKVDSSQLEIFPKVEDMAIVCEDIYRSFKLSALELNVKLVCKLDPCLQSSASEGQIAALALVDRSKMVVVMRNLVSNSLKFTPPYGEVCISLMLIDKPTTRPTNSGFPSGAVREDVPYQHTHMRVMVSDTGPGMTKDECAKLFKAFVQFSPNELQQGGGSGIGLYISYMIMSQSGLEIKVDSSKGVGTSFYIDLPLVVSDNDGDSSALDDVAQISTPSQLSSMPSSDVGLSVSPASLTRTRSKNATIMKNLSVLIVDDSPINRKMLIRTFQQYSIGSEAVIETAGDGLELLEKVGVSASYVPIPTSCTTTGTTTTTSSPKQENELGHVTEESKSSSEARQPVQTVTATAAAAGVEVNDALSRNTRPDQLKTYGIIIVDNHMPRMSGREAIQKLRESGYTGLIVGLTGDALAEDLQTFRDAGADIAFPKPFQVLEFKAFLAEFINNNYCPVDSMVLGTASEGFSRRSWRQQPIVIEMNNE